MLSKGGKVGIPSIKKYPYMYPTPQMTACILCLICLLFNISAIGCSQDINHASNEVYHKSIGIGRLREYYRQVKYQLLNVLESIQLLIASTLTVIRISSLIPFNSKFIPYSLRLIVNVVSKPIIASPLRDFPSPVISTSAVIDFFTPCK